MNENRPYVTRKGREIEKRGDEFNPFFSNERTINKVKTRTLFLTNDPIKLQELQ